MKLGFSHCPCILSKRNLFHRFLLDSNQKTQLDCLSPYKKNVILLQSLNWRIHNVCCFRKPRPGKTHKFDHSQSVGWPIVSSFACTKFPKLKLESFFALRSWSQTLKFWRASWKQSCSQNAKHPNCGAAWLIVFSLTQGNLDPKTPFWLQSRSLESWVSKVSDLQLRGFCWKTLTRSWVGYFLWTK